MQLARERSGCVVAAVGVAAAGDEALNDAFEPSRALGKRLDVLAQTLIVGVDFGAESLIVGVDFGAESLIVGAEGLVVGAELGAQGLVVGAGVAPECDEQTDQGYAQGEDGEEFGGHGRLLGVGVCMNPTALVGSTVARAAVVDVSIARVAQAELRTARADRVESVGRRCRGGGRLRRDGLLGAAMPTEIGIVIPTTGGKTLANVVGAKGEVVIAKHIRDQLGIGPGWVAIQRAVDDRVEIVFLPPEHRESLKGSLAPHMKASVPPDSWQGVRERGWHEAATREGEAPSSG